MTVINAVDAKFGVASDQRSMNDRALSAHLARYYNDICDSIAALQAGDRGSLTFTGSGLGTLANSAATTFSGNGDIFVNVGIGDTVTVAGVGCIVDSKSGDSQITMGSAYQQGTQSLVAWTYTTVQRRQLAFAAIADASTTAGSMTSTAAVSTVALAYNQLRTDFLALCTKFNSVLTAGESWGIINS